ncbi:GDSL-type esterase/lipase family protein [Williamsia sterculiae]|uniref:Lysophospholipase L1 n=1 Tax=Williamsia sterculiae TaxID=1344003 RepID=A0A1N7CWL4_9NOCA|nr:GDSL-type esterase/lipase family protein [Williamsia sterculiae]SIR67959.1 Lysophospholipase L1 [Williamsia sterculiae]
MRIRMAVAGAIVSALISGVGVAATAPVNAAPRPTCGTGWVTAFAARPTDPTLADPRLIPTLSGGEQSYRLVVTPGVDGTEVRVRLTNRFRPTPLVVGRATLAPKGSGANLVGNPRQITFGGSSRVTIPAGRDVVSDPIAGPVRGGAPLAVSLYVSGQGIAPTGHFNANTTSYYSLPGSGDATRDRQGGRFALTTTALPLVSALDVVPTRSSATVATLGDSITDGYVGGTYILVPENGAVTDRNVRYPDFLQRRLTATGSGAAVADAGITGNRVTRPGFVPMFGPAAIARLDSDVIGLSGVSDVIFMEGINDLGIPIGVNYEDLVRGYTDVINRLHARGIRVHLGTLLPASDALFDGITAPLANSVRIRLNGWIRSQKLSDSVVDFDKVVRDPRNPNIMNPRLVGVDNLHPNPAGYRAMAQAVNLGALRASGCGRP